MIYKTISSKYLIAKLFRDINPQDDNFVADAMEWLGEALEFVGTIPQYKLKAETIEVSGHKALLPCDLYLIEQVSLNGYPLKYSTSSFPFGLHCENCISNSSTATDASYIWVTNPNDPLGPTGDNFLPLKAGFSGYARESYYIDNNYIKTSFEEDTICLFYRAFNTDEDGYPLVPDNVQFKEASYWYIRMKMIGSGYEDPVFKYNDCEARWLKYVSQARAKADTPSYDQMESIKNQWVRLIPQLNRSNNFFELLGTQEELNRHYGR